MTDYKDDTDSKAAALVKSTAQGIRKAGSKVRVPETTGGKVAAAAALGAAAAAVAGLAKIISKRRAQGQLTRLRLEPNGDDAWRLLLDGEDAASADFDTKSDATEAARKLARESAPSELVILRSDGTEQDRHVYG